MKVPVSVVKGDLTPIIKPRPLVLGESNPLTNDWTCQVKVINGNGDELINRAVSETTGDAMRFLVYLTAAETSTLPVDVYYLVIEIENSVMTPAFNVEQRYILSVEPETASGFASIVLTPGTNSFDTYENLLNHIMHMPNMDAALNSDRMKLKTALFRAWLNIGILSVEFLDTNDKEIEPNSTYDFTTDIMAMLPETSLFKLRNAQCIEADFLLGGNPFEQRRRAGLMSDSTGESSHFMRPTKPVELPVCRDAAMALTPHVRYSAQTGKRGYYGDGNRYPWNLDRVYV